VDADINIASLPIGEAAGGPGAGPIGVTGEPTAFPCAEFTVCMNILNNRATVDLQDFPANKTVVLELGRNRQTADLLVAQGATDADGEAQIIFDMPITWADGQPIVETQLILVARTTSPAFTQIADISYAP
jgi:hypothetical protein